MKWLRVSEDGLPDDDARVLVADLRLSGLIMYTNMYGVEMKAQNKVYPIEYYMILQPPRVRFSKKTHKWIDLDRR